MDTALFFRKCNNSDQLKFLTEQLQDFGNEFTYEIVKTIVLDPMDFIEFKNDFLIDRDYISNITKELYMDEFDNVHCLLITNSKGNEKYLVYPSGYSYARYVAWLR